MENNYGILTPIFDEVYRMMTSKAVEKGYHKTGDLKRFQNPLMSIVESEFPGHTLGEIVYKCQRYAKKKNPEDLVKIIAWACLLLLNSENEASNPTSEAGGS